jgi:hypothetical protein
MASFLNQMGLKSQVPLEFRGYQINYNKTIEAVYNFTDEPNDPGRRIREENGILTAYAQTLLFYDQGKLSGESPHGLRIYEINTSGQIPKTFYISNATAEEFGSGQIDIIDYQERVYRTEKNMTEKKQELARDIAKSTKNGTISEP